MRSLGILGVLCVVAVPAFGAPVLYTFNSTAGTVQLNVEGQGSTISGLAGTFAIAIEWGNAHLDAGDSFMLGAAGLANTSTMKLGLAGIATANLKPGGAQFLAFAQAAPGVVPASVISTDVYLSATIFLTGLTTTTFKASQWAGTLLDFNVSVLPISASQSDVLTSVINGTFAYAVGITDVALTLTLDLVINIEGTAHAVPDPALGGLTALGLGGAGAWLRRRRS